MLELPPSPKQKNKINIGYSKVNYKQDDICALWVKASSSEFNLMLEKKNKKTNIHIITKSSSIYLLMKTVRCGSKRRWKFKVTVTWLNLFLFIIIQISKRPDILKVEKQPPRCVSFPGRQISTLWVEIRSHWKVTNLKLRWLSHWDATIKRPHLEFSFCFLKLTESRPGVGRIV